MKGTDWLAIAMLLFSASAEAKKEPPPPQFVVIRSLPPSAVVARTQANCIQHGMSVAATTETSVTCTKPMDDSFKSMFIRALATPSYSTNPVYHYRVSAVRVGPNTTVAAEEFLQYQNAYGQVTTIPITKRKELEAIHQGLVNMKTSWEARLDAAGGDEAAALAASDAAFAASGGMVTSPVPASTSTAVPVQAAPPGDASASAHPSAPAAKQLLTQLQCTDGFRIVGESAGKTLFEAQCREGKTQIVECRGMSCNVLN